MKIAVVRPGHLGDVLVAVPALRALRAAFPAAEVHLFGLAHTRAAVERLAAYVGRFVELPGFPGMPEGRPDAGPVVALLAAAQREGYDLAIQLKGSGVFSNPLTKLLGARRTIGFVRPEDTPAAFGLDAALVFDEARHEVLRPLDLLAAIGVPPRGHALELPVLEEDHGELDRALATAGVEARGRPLLAVHPGARIADRRWPADRFGLAAACLARRLDAVVAVTGLEHERPLAARVAAVPGRTVNLAGHLSLGGLAALLARAALVLTNDTGPAHLAYACRAPSVTIFGPTSVERWGPLDRQRHRTVCAPPPGRIEDVGVDTVLAAAGALVPEAGARPVA